jgi:hypothetical protein
VLLQKPWKPMGCGGTSPLELWQVDLHQGPQFLPYFLPGTRPENGWFWVIFILHRGGVLYSLSKTSQKTSLSPESGEVKKLQKA